MTTTQEVIDALAEINIGASPEHVPSEISFALDAFRVVLLTRGHNRDGWEAVVDTEGDQYSLEDGPEADAPAAEVAAWVDRLLNGGWKEY